MITYTFIDQLCSEEISQITDLYRKEGWWNQEGENHDTVRQIIAGSHCFLLVRDDRRVVGMGRAISDGISDAYIQDVMVMDACRGRGMGTRIIKALIDRLERDGIRWIGLIAERDTYPFYERLGFSVMKRATPMLRVD